MPALRDKFDGNIESLDGSVFGVLVGSLIESVTVCSSIGVPGFPARKSFMNDAPNIEQEIARLIVDTLHLEDLAPEQIEPEARLFGDGLGLDSLDMLELSMEVEQIYGVALRSDDPEHIKVFASLRSLSEYIQLHRVG